MPTVVDFVEVSTAGLDRLASSRPSGRDPTHRGLLVVVRGRMQPDGPPAISTDSHWGCPNTTLKPTPDTPEMVAYGVRPVPGRRCSGEGAVDEVPTFGDLWDFLGEVITTLVRGPRAGVPKLNPPEWSV